jgi:hypothetical protein
VPLAIAEITLLLLLESDDPVLGFGALATEVWAGLVADTGVLATVTSEVGTLATAG